MTCARVGVEGGERGDRADEEAHRVGVVAEGLDEVLDVRVQHRVVADVALPARELGRGGQLAEDHEVRRLEVVRAFGSSSIG